MEEMKYTEDVFDQKDTAMTDLQKEQLYQRALGYLTSSLTNNELFEESLDTLLALGDYKDSAALYQKYNLQYAAKQEETAALNQKRKASRIFQGVMVGIGFAVILSLILILVYALKLDIVR